MKKQFAAVSAIVLTLALTTCSSPIAQARQLNTDITKSVPFENNLKALSLKHKQIKKQIAIKKELKSNSRKIHTVINSVKKRVGKTWYVFSGSTPDGWDCSGLVLWAYKNVGVNLKHSASFQKNYAKQYKTPKPGDIVAFGWNGYSGAQHVGIYIGHGKMIHVGKRGELTQIVNIRDWAGGMFSKITYTRILKTT